MSEPIVDHDHEHEQYLFAQSDGLRFEIEQFLKTVQFKRIGDREILGYLMGKTPADMIHHFGEKEDKHMEGCNVAGVHPFCYVPARYKLAVIAELRNNITVDTFFSDKSVSDFRRSMTGAKRLLAQLVIEAAEDSKWFIEMAKNFDDIYPSASEFDYFFNPVFFATSCRGWILKTCPPLPFEAFDVTDREFKFTIEQFDFDADDGERVERAYRDDAWLWRVLAWHATKTVCGWYLGFVEQSLAECESNLETSL